MTSTTERQARIRAMVIAFGCLAVLNACGSASNDQRIGTSGGTTSAPPEVAEACRLEDPPTAGNRVSWFLSDVVQGRDPNIRGGVDDPFGCAYAQLCSDLRARVSEAEFRASRA